MEIIKKEGSIAKRTFIEIRRSILLSLASGQKTINQISVESQINWKTVENHLIYLIGRGWVREVFHSPYARILELTAFGKDYFRKNVSTKVKISDEKIVKMYSEQ